MSVTLSNKTLKVFVVLWIACFSFNHVHAQGINVVAKNKPLSEVLIDLSNRYNKQVSFNHRLLSQCYVTDSNYYVNYDEALSNLVQQCQLTYEFSDGVYIIYEQSTTADTSPKKKISYHYSGQLIDGISLEPLPYSSIQLSDFSLLSDASGNFAFNTNDDAKALKISYLGYYVLDTVLKQGLNQSIKLTPSVIGLDEIVVHSNAAIYTAFIGERPGLIKINKKVASFLPGNNNNTLFNLLRLQPGILATAEQSGDYIIWGSYRGQTLLQFDGIPLFSANSLNNEIGVINPLMVKDVEVFKAGYNVDKGDRVGGIIEMTGNLGNTKEFSANVNLNSQTLSGSINIPLAEKFALQAAFRQSYYSVIDWDELMTESSLDDEKYQVPEYQFQDLNLKFSGRFYNGDDFYISLIGNNDNSAFYVEEKEKARGKAWENTMEKQQFGIAASYNKKWKKVGVTNFIFSQSKLLTSAYDHFNSFSQGENSSRKSDDRYRENSIQEVSLKAEHTFPKTGNHDVSLGLGLVQNNTQFTQDTLPISQYNKENSSNRMNVFLKDNISLGRFILLQPGIKIDMFSENNKVYALPRITAIVKPLDEWSVNIAWGIYNQYITEMAMFDYLGNSYYFWGLSDGAIYPVVSSMHNVLGLSFKNNGFKIGAEGFYKTTEGLSRLINDRNKNGYVVRHGDSRAYGIDFYTKKRINKHDLWISYTLSKAEEKFGQQNEVYRLAPQNQTHEIKVAGIFNFKPWYFSANYVYGSGLEGSSGIKQEGVVPYHRLDVAFLYKFNTNKFNLESGLSVVNVLNYENVGYSTVSKLPNNNNTYAKGIPFTPSVFINIGF